MDSHFWASHRGVGLDQLDSSSTTLIITNNQKIEEWCFFIYITGIFNIYYNFYHIHMSLCEYNMWVQELMMSRRRGCIPGARVTEDSEIPGMSNS